MGFCAQCESFFVSEEALCPSCGATQPPTQPVHAPWLAVLERIPSGPPLVVGHVVLVPTQAPGAPAQHSALRALNRRDGSVLWTRSFEYAMVSGLAELPDSSESSGSWVLVAAASTDLLRGDGVLLALDTAGEERWRWAPGVQSVSAPAVAGEVVCVTADAQTLMVLELADGAERTTFQMEASASLSAPAVVGDVAYIPCRGPHLLAVDLRGCLRWQYDAEASGAWLDWTPVMVGERVFTVLSTGVALALRLEDGSLAWRAGVGPEGKRLSPPATDGERLFIGARDGVYALDLANGHQLWSFPTLRRIEAAPVVVGGVVYAPCHDHHVYALDAATGQELWRYEVERRIEVSPAVTSPPEAWTFVADRGGGLAAVARPLSALEHEAAGHGVDAASAYADLGQFARGAQVLEDHDELFKAAELWRVAGDSERAATQYETVGAWRKAAELWDTLGWSLKRAQVLEGHARSLAGGPHSEEEQAIAWAAAARAFEVEGEMERAGSCQREVARCLRQPIVTLDVQHEGLVQDAYSRLQFFVRNEGYGPARNLIIRATGDQFEGQVMATREIVTLRAGYTRTDWLDVRPRAFGDSVPLRVCLEYEDRARGQHSFEHTIHIPVARTGAARREGQLINVFIEQGDFVVGDKAIGMDQRWQQVLGLQTDVAREVARENLDVTPSPEATRLRRILESRLNLDEFRTLCSDVGVNYDHLGGEGLPGKARELVLHLQRREQLSLLKESLRRERPDIEVQ